MNILINATNLKTGGAVQVTDSICMNLSNFPQHTFTVVLSSCFDNLAKKIEGLPNITVVRYNIKNSIQTLLWGRDSFLDKLVDDNKIDIVITIFGPSRWNPKTLHLCGFAMPHLVLEDSPYFTSKSIPSRLKHYFRNRILSYYFKRSTNYFYTENPYISDLLAKLFNIENIYTITNYYNQVFDNKESWIKRSLPEFTGHTLLTISSWYEHKNIPIVIDIARELKSEHPNFRFRFVITITENELGSIPEFLKENIVLIGKVAIEECPSLYEQSDVMFLPTLLECFSASYAEAMRMKKPIITTDLPFAHGLCGECAEYYSPLSAKDAAEKIYNLLTNKARIDSITQKGEKHLKNFDDYNSRTAKLIQIAEQIVKDNKIA